MRRSNRPDGFDRFVRDAEPRLRRALVAAYGPQAGRDATVDALAWAWANWERVQELENPIGYLYRVGQTKAREARRPQPVVEPVAGDDARLPWVEPQLDPALDELTEPQRVAVVPGWVDGDHHVRRWQRRQEVRDGRGRRRRGCALERRGHLHLRRLVIGRTSGPDRQPPGVG